MDPLQLRKVILTGMRFDAPDGAPLLDREGLPIAPRKHPVILQVVFWVPRPKPFQRCDGRTIVGDARPFEIQALADGAIIEHVEELTFPEQPTVAELQRRLVPVWEGLTHASLGLLPNAFPRDDNPNASVVLSPISNR